MASSSVHPKNDPCVSEATGQGRPPAESNSGWPWRPMIEAIRVISQSIHPHHAIRYRLQCREGTGTRDKRSHVELRTLQDGSDRARDESSVGKGELASKTRTTAWLSPSHGDGGPRRNEGAHSNHRPLGFFLSFFLPYSSGHANLWL